jgi:hypothetical protein
MQQHNGFWISGRAVTGPPFTDYWTPAGAVFFQRQRFRRGAGAVQPRELELDDQGVAALFGLELARLVVDTSYVELVAQCSGMLSDELRGQNLDGSLGRNVSV